MSHVARTAAGVVAGNNDKQKSEASIGGEKVGGRESSGNVQKLKRHDSFMSSLDVKQPKQRSGGNNRDLPMKLRKQKSRSPGLYSRCPKLCVEFKTH